MAVENIEMSTFSDTLPPTYERLSMQHSLSKFFPTKILLKKVQISYLFISSLYSILFYFIVRRTNMQNNRAYVYFFRGS